MSFNNHDNEDPNRVKYSKSLSTTLGEYAIEGKAIKIYTMASTMPLSEFIKWFKENQSKQ